MPFPAIAAPVLWSAFLTIIGAAVSRVLIALGVGFAQYKGMDLLLTKVTEQIDLAIGGAPAKLVALMGLCGFGIGINIILSAVAIRFAIGGVFNGTLVSRIWQARTTTAP